MFCMLKKKKKYSCYFSKQIKLPKAIYCFNHLEQRRIALSHSKKVSALLRGINVWIVFTRLEQKTNLKHKQIC